MSRSNDGQIPRLFNRKVSIMSKAQTALDITAQVAKYAPIAISLILAAEQSAASGAEKKEAVLAAIFAGAEAGEHSTDAVVGVSTLVDNIVSVFNMLKTFQK
jgi:ethanolamine ammonia-lyase large subunit